MTPFGADTGSNATVLEIAELMLERGQPAVPIAARDGKGEGVIAALDIVYSLARGNDPASTKAVDISKGAATIAPDATLDEAEELMQEQRNVAVVVDDGVLVGLVDRWQLQKYVEALRILGPDAERLITEISPLDKACQRYRGGHLHAAVDALVCIREAMAAASRRTVTSVLDFPSGYGRVLRVLKAAFPEARLTAVDVDTDAVDFCARVLGATPIYSTQRPQDIQIDDRFDLIWSGSLLTHIDSDRWPGFLSLFRDALVPDGLLVFTTHGRHPESTLAPLGFDDDQVAAILRDYDRDGFGYLNYPHLENYGITIASPDWVRTRLDEAGLREISYAERRWDAPAPLQDVIACVPA